MTSHSVRRWRFWTCILYGRTDPTGVGRDERDLYTPCPKRNAVQGAKQMIHHLKKKYGWEARVFTHLPRHANSGHVHVVALISRKELSDFLNARLE